MSSRSKNTPTHRVDPGRREPRLRLQTTTPAESEFSASRAEAGARRSRVREPPRATQVCRATFTNLKTRDDRRRCRQGARVAATNIGSAFQGRARRGTGGRKGARGRTDEGVPGHLGTQPEGERKSARRSLARRRRTEARDGMGGGRLGVGKRRDRHPSDRQARVLFTATGWWFSKPTMEGRIGRSPRRCSTIVKHRCRGDASVATEHPCPKWNFRRFALAPNLPCPQGTCSSAGTHGGAAKKRGEEQQSERTRVRRFSRRCASELARWRKRLIDLAGALSCVSSGEQPSHRGCERGANEKHKGPSQGTRRLHQPLHVPLGTVLGQFQHA